MNPPANESPAPVGSFTSSIGNAGARKGCAPMPKAPSRKKMVAPYSPCFTTSAFGPMARTFLAARGIFFWNAWLKSLEYIQFREVGLGLVQVVEILSAPAEGLALGPLDAARVHTAFFQHGFVFGRKVFAYHRDHPHLGKVTRGQREISGRPSENVAHAARRRGDGVESNRTNYENAHESP